MNFKKTTLYIIIALSSIFSNIYGGGVVYLVLGSDTAIWDGMSTSRYNNYYNIDLYTNPSRNAYRVMDPSFRSQLKDSYGTPLKMTWWMMAGNIFRYATNKNVPVPNIMTLYLMKKYHGENVIENGDELTLHYHTFFWSDYDGDGNYYWNQSKTFLESLDDFNVTLAQFLIEEETFPVSFRSGWHYMDNDWQHYLDQKILPYGMHNDYPNKRLVDEEPIDNIFDWSKTPAAWKPYRPSYTDYQIPGKGKGWNIRSVSFQRTLRANYIDSIFAAASNGENQIACLWAHLPETDFIDNIVAVDNLAHEMETKYPGVTFKYCTAIEAMQLWQESRDSQKPSVTISEINSGDRVFYEIESDEKLFQEEPFVAIKDIYENYYVAQCVSIGEKLWKTKDTFLRKDLVKVGVTACDTVGNQSMEFIEYLPKNKFIDNSDSQYIEILGNWNSTSKNAWGTDSRIVQLNESDSVSVQWKYGVTKSTNYNCFIQVPEIDNPVETFEYVVNLNSIAVDTIRFNKSLKPFSWIYLTTILANENDELIIEYRATSNNQVGKFAIADVVKVSAFVKERELKIDETIINLNEFVVSDTINYPLVISNNGSEPLKIFGVSSYQGSLISEYSYPLEVPQMSLIEIPLQFQVNEIGIYKDSLIILSDDNAKSRLVVPILASVQKYFAVVDNEDESKYFEYGQWNTSVALANGNSSRYSYLNITPKNYAEFKFKLDKSGTYNISEILPKTVNSSNYVLYSIIIDDVLLDSFFVNQNTESGAWKFLGSYLLHKNTEIKIKIADTGESTEGVVLRTDAFKFQLIEELTSVENSNGNEVNLNYVLNQNYPNPFNPSTRIDFHIPKYTYVKLDVFNLLGEKISSLINENLNAGAHSVIWNGDNTAGIKVTSGVYFYRITSGNFVDTKKMIYLR